MKLKFYSLLVFLLLFVLCNHLAFSQPAAINYKSADEAKYKSYSRESQYVAMSDSVKLAVDVYLPKKGPEKENFPVVFVFTPYGRAYLAPEIGPHLRLLTWIFGAGWQPVIDQYTYSPSVKLLIEHGYAVVVADMRGTGVSYGHQMPLDPIIGKDGKELIDWISAQPFSNGNVGMMGLSYLGWAQYITAAQHPEALRCIAPEVIFFESYTSSFKPGGILATRWLESFSERLNLMNLNFFKLKKFYLPAVPVIDEDSDGRLQDEWPGIDSTIFSSGAVPRYKDHQNRTEHIYWNATREHLENLRVADLMHGDFGYFDSATPESYPGFTYRDVAPGYYLPKVHELNLPVMQIGRWQDGFIRGTMQLHASSQHLDNQYLLVNPGFHIPLLSKSNRNFMGYKEKPNEVIALSHLMFFDKYLKKLEISGEKNPVQLFVAHSGWRSEKQWPPQASVNRAYYLADGVMGRDIPGDGVDTLKIDSLHSSVFGKKKYSRWTMASGAPKKPMDRSKIDKRATVYQTSVLEKDTEVIGHPIVEVWISANRPDADLFVYLEDVDKKGNAMYVSEGQLRASWHQECSLEEQMGVNYSILPELPWHGFTNDYCKPNVLENSEPIKMRFDLFPVAWNFKKGHSLRISIAGLDRDNFEINPAYFLKGNMDGVEIYLHQGQLYPSRVILPIIEGEVDVPVSAKE